MSLPFTVAQFFEVFAAYNAAIWPAQLVAYGLGLFAVGTIVAAAPFAAKIVLAILAALWAVNAIAYHLLFFAAINPAAYVFAAFFIVQAALFAADAATAPRVAFRFARDLRSMAAAAAIAYAMIVYPALGVWAGRDLTTSPIFGVAPCPTVVFTLGVLLIGHGRAVVYLSVVPILWSLVGLAAALQLGMREDFALPMAGLALVAVLARDAVLRAACPEPIPSARPQP